MHINKSTLALIVAGISAGNLYAGTQADNIKWNVMVLMTDVQNVHYPGCDHQSRENILTPNLDKLGKDGMIFRKAYVAFSVCSPTLTSLLTGVYPFKHGQFLQVHTNDNIFTQKVIINQNPIIR